MNKVISTLVLMCVLVISLAPIVASEEISREETLVIVTGQEPAGFEPGYMVDNMSTTMCHTVYDTLTDYIHEVDEAGRSVAYRIGPSLAKSWELSEDGKTYTFHLVENAVFTSGNPVDAHAVKASLERIPMQEAGAVWQANRVGFTLDSITVIDDFTFKMELTNPCPFLLGMLQIPNWGAIVDPAEVEAHGGIVQGQPNEWLMLNTAGSGPYVIDYWTPGEELVFRRNDEYWAMTPYFKRVVLRFVTEASTRELLVRSGEADIAMDILLKDWDRIDALDGVEVLETPTIETVYVGMNHEKEPWNDPFVRKTIAYAIPYEDILSNVLFNKATRPYGAMNPTMLGYKGETWYYDFDMDKAAEMLAKSAYPDGFSTVIDITTGVPEEETVATIIKQNLATLGIDVQVRKSDRPAWLDIVYGKIGDMFISHYTPYVNDPGYFASVWWTCGQRSNHSNYCHPGFGEWVESMMYEQDIELRIQKCHDMQVLFAEDCGFIPVYRPNYGQVQREDIGGYVYYPNRLLHYEFFYRET